MGQSAADLLEAKATRATPAADVLVVNSDPAKASRFGKLPVIALQQYGLGSALCVATDNTWRREQLPASENSIVIAVTPPVPPAEPLVTSSPSTRTAPSIEQ